MKIVKSIVVFLIGVSIFVLTACGVNTLKIDMKKYVEVEISGLNGQGEVECYIDWSALTDDLVSKGNIDESVAYTVCTLIDVKLSNIEEYGTWSNGDTVEIICDYDAGALEKMGFEIVNATNTFTIEGLSEGVAHDPFAAISVSFEGFSGFGEGKIEVIDTTYWREETIYSKGSFEIVDNYWIKNGDIVTVKFNDADTTTAKNNNFLIEETEKEYVVSGLTEFFMDNTYAKEIEAKEYEYISQKVKEHAKYVYWSNVKDFKFVYGIGTFGKDAKNLDDRNNMNVFYYVYEANCENRQKAYVYVSIANYYLDENDELQTNRGITWAARAATLEEMKTILSECINTEKYNVSEF